MQNTYIKWCAISVLIGFGVLLQAGPVYPQWWLDQGAVGSGDFPPPPGPGEAGYNQTEYDAWMANNYKVPNLGQAKNMAHAAYNAMEAASSGSAGSTIQSMVTGFSTDPQDNYVAVNVGQLKALAAPFYDRMYEEDFDVVLAGDGVLSSGYPWSASTPIEDNYALASLGQLKYIFSFSLDGWPGLQPPSPPTAANHSYARIIVSETYTVVGQPISIEGIASFVGDTVDNIEFFVDAVSLSTADTSSPYEDSWTPSSTGLFTLHAVAESSGSATAQTPFVTVKVQADSNTNGLGDAWESATGVTSPTSDGDGDGYLAADEYASGSSPSQKDHPVVELGFFSVTL